MAGSLFVEIVTPESALWAGNATALIGRSSDGEFTVLAQHTPLVGDIVPSVVRVTTADGERSFVVHGGFFQVGSEGSFENTRATVLAGIVEDVATLDVPRAQAAKDAADAALAALRGDEGDGGEVAALRAALARAELRLAAAH
ncbi:MAG: F0F1 ATP synthase subunit epsilon [Actinomycetota bacterium]